ncbi:MULTISPECIES: hypothetical protein [Novosphingobium]|uniref:Uncharacterized protein n=2 Tax=Sphingomonadaceae TaxID=41297 RepID=G6EEZ9_9SPHN|nr:MULTISPECIES: hypothetical protein [Novosphingobium]AIT79279.1 hypothetical protein JI59_05485 [Novosphingobium pentaromativorans US6-1]EHJ60125.1 hypothetical protein NSU_2920 [Novosphingobium pentaromativorans US6-1]
MKAMKRRALVLTDEAARHPFRRSLPAHVRLAPLDQEVQQDNALARLRWKMTGGDWQSFLQAYCASLVAMLVFIA